MSRRETRRMRSQLTAEPGTARRSPLVPAVAAPGALSDGLAGFSDALHRLVKDPACPRGTAAATGSEHGRPAHHSQGILDD